MRNLKKALSLALALVMLLGMMMVGAGAAAFDDVPDGSEKQAAVEIMNTLSIIKGDAGSKDFRPNDTLTRAEAAVIISKVLMTPTIMDKFVRDNANVTSKFADVAAYQGGWATPYVEACVASQVILGDDDGNFAPEREVSGVEFAAMLLRVLDIDQGQFVNWPFDWQKAALEAKLDDNDADVFADKLSREDAAQMALNALLRSPKGDETTYKVTATHDDDPENNPDQELYNGSSKDVAYLNLTTARSSAKYEDWTVALSTTTVNVDSLGQKSFGLTKKATTDELGRTAVNYTAPAYKLDKLVIEAADYTLNGKVTNAAMYATVGKDVADYTWETKVDGVDAASPALKPQKGGSSAFQGTEAGMVTEVYIHNDIKKVNVLISNYYLGTVSKVTPAKGNTAAYVIVDGMRYETEDYAKNDVVLYTKESKTITSMQIAPELTGTLTKIVNANTYTIDGKDYVKSAQGDVTGLGYSALGTEVTFYTDTQDNIMALKGLADIPTDYIYVAAHSAAKDNPEYITSTTYPKSIEVYGVQANGEIIKLNVVQIGSDKIGAASTAVATVSAGDTHKGLYTITPTNGDAVILTKITDKAVTNNIEVNKPAITGSVSGGVVANSQTAFIFIEQANDANGDKTITNVTVKTGIANIGTDIITTGGTPVTAWLGVDGKTVEAVFVLNAFEDGLSNATGVVYITGGEKAIQAWEDNTRKTWYTYSCKDEFGDTVTLTSKTQLSKDSEGNDVVYAGMVYEYDENGFLLNPVPSGRLQAGLAVTAVKGSTVWLDTVAHSFNNVSGETNVIFVRGDGAGVEAGQVVTLVTKAASGKAQWDAQVIFITSAASESVDVKPTKENGKVTVEANPGTSFTTQGSDPVTTVTIPDVGTKDGITDWGKPDETRGFTFASGGVAGDYTLTIMDENGTVKYQEKMEGLTTSNKGGVFYVQVVNLTKGQTAVSNSTGSHVTTELTQELDVGTYSWNIKCSVGDKIVANGAFYIGTNGDNNP